MPPAMEAGSPNSWFPIYTDIERNKYRRCVDVSALMYVLTHTHTFYIYIEYIYYIVQSTREGSFQKRMSIHCTQILVSKYSSPLKRIRTPWRNSRCPGLGRGKYKMHLEHFFFLVSKNKKVLKGCWNHRGVRQGLTLISSRIGYFCQHHNP